MLSKWYLMLSNLIICSVIFSVIIIHNFDVWLSNASFKMITNVSKRYKYVVNLEEKTTVPSSSSSSSSSEEWGKETAQVIAAYYSYQIHGTVLTVKSEANKLTDPKPLGCALYDSSKQFIQFNIVKFYTSYLFYCLLSPSPNATTNSTEVASYITLFALEHQDPEDPEWLVPIVDLEQRKRDIEKGITKLGDIAVHFGVFGNPDRLMIIQFMEWYKIQGVSKIVVSVTTDLNAHTPDDVLDILVYYKKQGILEIWDFYPSCNYYNCQLLLNNNFILHFTHVYQYLLLVDADELLQPVDPNVNIIQMVRKIDKPKYGSLTFAALYHTTADVVVSNPENRLGQLQHENIATFVHDRLPMLNYNRSATKCMFIGFSPKTIVKPEFIQKMWVHFVNKHFEKKKQHSVPCPKDGSHLDGIGYFHHFKNESVWGETHFNKTIMYVKYEHRPPYQSPFNAITTGSNEQLTDNVIEAIRNIILKT